MYTPTDRSQFQAWAIQQGNHQLVATHQTITDWISKQFGVLALDFCFERRETTKGLSQQLVHVIVETADDVKRLQSNRVGNKLVGERFLEYFKSADVGNYVFDPTKSNVFPAETNPFPEIIVTYRPLKPPTEEMRQKMLDDEVRTTLKAFSSVWTISQNVIFYYTAAQVKDNETDGTSTKINQALEQVSKKYGFAPGSSCSFDSKESFDRNYESNWYYYWK